MLATRLRARITAWPALAFWLAASAVLGAVACFVPLLETLGYELSLATALLASLGAGHVATTVAPRIRGGKAPPLEPGPAIPALYGRALAAGMSLLAAPLALSLLNAARVPPCNLAEGALFFVLLPVISVAAAAACGLAIGASFRRARSAAAAWFCVWLASLLAAGIEFYATPAVFLYGPFFGWFPGVLYDTLLEVRRGLVTYRVVTLLDVAAILAISAAALDRGALLLKPTLVGSGRKAAIAAAALLLAAIGAHLAGPPLGHAARRCDLERELPTRVSRDGLDLYFPDGIDPEIARESSDDAAFSLAEVEAFFETGERRRISVFFFATAADKGRAMGAARTNVTKPWRGEVYVVVDEVPHEVLRHELAHAVAASFGRGPFALAGDAFGIVPSPGLVEGYAVAAEGPRGELTTHQWAAAMRRLDLLPPLARTMGLDFFDLAASTAYTAAGSFVRWLRAEHGAAALRRIYGGAAFEAATGHDLGALERRWHAFLDTVDLEPRDLAAARMRFDRPSVIGSTCVHEVARLNAAAAELASEGRLDRAIETLETALLRSGDSTLARLDLFAALAASRRRGAVVAMGRELLSSGQLGSAQRDRIAEVLVDLDAEGGRCPAAAERYAALVPGAPSDDLRRRLQVKAHLCRMDAGGAVAPILDALAAEPAAHGSPDALAALRIGELAAGAGDPWLDHLAARQHARLRDREGTIEWLDAAERHGLAATSKEVVFAAGTLRGRALFHLGRLEEARAVFAALSADAALREGQRAHAADWTARCGFASRTRAPVSLDDPANSN
ncbi:MAG: hypothetical protein M0R80_12830 [Proteobacteria bacterium]|jgi:hypothetical protein|nr:hypothetical protein [Pseudomonadota bacterium]